MNLKKLGHKNKETRKVKEDLKKRFEDLKEREVTRADERIVNVKIRVGCGCGGDYEWFHGTVPVDSSIDTGDYFDALGDFQDAGAYDISSGWYDNDDD